MKRYGIGVFWVTGIPAILSLDVLPVSTFSQASELVLRFKAAGMTTLDSINPLGDGPEIFKLYSDLSRHLERPIPSGAN